MALTIKERSGTFFVQGTIDSTTASSFKNHFKFLMNANVFNLTIV